MSVDVLVVGPHPDDAELGAGGTLALLAQRGLRMGILDLTRGELGTRGTPELRAVEAAAAAAVLNVAERVQLGLPDGGVANTPQQRDAVASALRTLRPRLLIVPQAPDRHPDHTAAHALLMDAHFQAGLSKWDDGQEPHRAEAPELFYHPYAEQETMPALVQDISETFELKLAALRAYKSQFYNPEYSGAETLVSSPAFWEGITARARYWGHRVGVQYGEPFYARAPLALNMASVWLRRNK